MSVGKRLHLFIIFLHLFIIFLFYFFVASGSMVNVASIFACLGSKNEEEKLLQNKKAGADSDSSGLKTALIALVVSIVYILGGGCIFWLAEYWSETKWTFLDALYFSVVTVSTVGYGDLTPSTSIGLWLGIFYMFFGIALVGIALGIVGGFLMARQEAMLLEAAERSTKKRNVKRKLTGTQLRLLGAIGVLFIFLAIGVLGFWLCFQYGSGGDPDFSFTDAVFLTVQTVTTVGYGNYSNNTAAQIFCIPYILFSTLLVAAALGTFADVFIERQQEKMAERILKADFDLEAILAMDTDGDASIDMAEFLEYMLVNMGKCTKIDIEKVKNQFRELDVDGSGSLDQDDIKLMQEKMMSEQQATGNTSTQL